MQPIDEDDAIRSMTNLWLKWGDVSAAIEDDLAKRGTPARNVPGQLWNVLQALKGKGFANFEWGPPAPVCQLTPAGLKRKKELLQPA